MQISKIYLYDEPAVPEINISHLSKFLKENFSAEVEERKSLLLDISDFRAKEIASCRIFNPRKNFQKHSPTFEEIFFEKRIENSSKNNIIMYDGFEFQKTITDLIAIDELNHDQFHVVFTNKLTCTYDNSDYRYHGRALIASNPAIISTTGIIEAPAKPRQYYMDLITNYNQGLNLDSIKEKYSGTFLEYHDKRLAQIIEGYLLQAIFYYCTGNPFCENPDCRLFNAHWQRDLLYSQIESGNLCEKHEKILKNL